MADAYSQQTPFPPVQQLQDSSTLESQALSTSFQQQDLLHVPGSEPIAVVSTSTGTLVLTRQAALSLFTVGTETWPAYEALVTSYNLKIIASPVKTSMCSI